MTGTEQRRSRAERAPTSIPRQAADLEQTAIAIDELQANFTGLAPAREALIVDACVNGGRSWLSLSEAGFSVSVELGRYPM